MLWHVVVWGAFLFGSTTAEGSTSWPQVTLTLYASGLQQPVHLTHAGDGSGRVFAVEQGGRIYILGNGRPLDPPFLDISHRVSCCGEQGLLSLAFPPQYQQKQYFYVNYTDTAGDTIIARYAVTSDPNIADANREEIVLIVDQPFANHNGGQLAFGPDGFLYIGMGDGGSGGDPQENGQNPLSLLGKILRLDVESGLTPYEIPVTNPFVGISGVLGEIWALGLRNPWRFSFDRQTGDLYSGDVGQSAYEEVNFQPATSPGGENYGWNRMEGAHCYASLACDQAGLTFPVAEYDHAQGCSITGGTTYRGSRFPRLDGIYFYGDYCNGRIWGLRHVENTWQNSLLLDTAYNISSFGEDEAGEVYLVDYANGDVYALLDPAPLGPDLLGSWVDLSQTCRGAGRRLRCRITGTFNAQNFGTTGTQRSSLRIFLSRDLTVDGNDMLLQRISIEALGAGQTQQVDVQRRFPFPGSASGQFVIAVLDATGRVSETDETNNVVVFGPVP